MKRAIEEYFPIIDINRLAVPERNAFKPIYQMHKWFARRSSSVFRAILLAALKPAGTDIMEEFYKDHTNDPDTKGKVILDPFMGGGTTVVEALRLGCKVIGVDLNPVAWFIVKTEVEPADIEELKKGFERLANRRVEWSGRPLKETLLSFYKTECPACGNKDADIIYTFWVKSAPCTTPTCNHYTQLFSDYIIAQKNPSIRYIPDYGCPKCYKRFDWEREPAALVGERRLMVNAGISGGEGRNSTRWTYSDTNIVHCPWCSEEITLPPSGLPKLERKKVPVSILYCPNCEEVWQHRGDMPDNVECPTCGHIYNAKEGNLPEKGKFVCKGTCGGNKDDVITAIRMLPEDQLLPTRQFGIEGYCDNCAQTEGALAEPRNQINAFHHSVAEQGAMQESLIWKNNGKFYKRVDAVDVQRYKAVTGFWLERQQTLPYPKAQVQFGHKTKTHLLGHHYRFWHQMFNSRHLLALATLLEGIMHESASSVRYCLLSALYGTLNNSSDFASYRTSVGASRQVFARHDFHPKLSPCEINIWGTKAGMGSFCAMWSAVLEGKAFNYRPFDRRVKSEPSTEKVKLENVPSEEMILGTTASVLLQAKSSTSLDGISEVDAIITDPPYASNVDYSELSDYFYVWLRPALFGDSSQFAPETTPKSEEIVQNATRGKSAHDFKVGLEQVFRECHRVLRMEGLLAFTFHHSEDEPWEALLAAVCDSGFYVEAVFPIHGEAESSLHLQGNESVSYDLIHVCRKRAPETRQAKRSWAGVRNEIRKLARQEAQGIQAGRYGHEPLNPADINILLVGKCLELYSKHYGNIVDHEDNPVPIHRALEEIKMLVDQIVTKDSPLPPELADVDVPSYIYFTTLCAQKEIKSDDVSKSTRGIIETGELRARGLIIKGREKRGRTFEIKQPLERLGDLKGKFHLEWPNAQITLFGDEGQPILPKGFLFVDCVHFLLGLAEAQENLVPWLEHFRGLRPQIRAALEYLAQRNPSFEKAANIVLGLMDERGLLAMQAKTQISTPLPPGEGR